MCVCQGVIKNRKHLLRKRRAGGEGGGSGGEEVERKKYFFLFVSGIWREINGSLFFAQKIYVEAKNTRGETPDTFFAALAQITLR